MNERKALKNKISSLLSTGTSVTLLGLDGIGNTYFYNEVSKIARNDYKIHIVEIDCQEFLERNKIYFYRSLLFGLKKAVEKYDPEAGKNGSLVELLGSSDLFILTSEINSTIRDLLEYTDPDPVVIVINEITQLENLDKAFYTGLKTIRKIDKNRLAFLFRDNYRFINTFSLDNTGELYKLLMSKIYWIPMPEGESFDSLIKDSEKRFDINLSKDQLKKIITLTGRHAGLTKYVISSYSSTGSFEPDKLLVDGGVMVRIEKLLKELNENELELCKSISKGEKIKSDFVKSKYLLNSSFLTVDEEGNLTHKIKLIEEQLKIDSGVSAHRVKDGHQENGDHLIKINGDEIVVNDARIEEDFTNTELGVLKLLYGARGNVVSRDTIANEMWGYQADEKYSDWAIDQMISRLRKKIGDSGYKPEVIKTLRGRGFKIP